MAKSATFGRQWFDGKNNNFLALNQLVGTYGLNPNPNLYNNVSGAPITQINYQAPTAGGTFYQDPAPAAGTSNWHNSLGAEQTDTKKENYVYYQSLPPQPAAQDLSDHPTPTNLDVPTYGTSDNNYQNLSLQEQKQRVENVLQGGHTELIDALLKSIEIDQKQITERIKDSAEADISKNTNDLFQNTQKFLIYSTIDQLNAGIELGKDSYTTKVSEGGEWHQKAQIAFKNITDDPLYSKEINNEQERRDICERTLRFIGNTTSRVIGLGLGFGAAVAVASLMIPPAVVLYGPIIVAGPVIAVGAGGAAAFMANKLGYKIADLTISNTAAFAGKILDGGKNKVADLWKSWKGDKQQEKALTTFKNNLLQEIETAQKGFVEAKNKNDSTKMTEHLENLYINASVLKDLETSIVGKRAAEKKEQEALENWKQNASFMEKTAKKMGAEEAWKFISETRPKNICEKLGVITGKILGLAIAAGVGAAAAVAITTSIGAAATILYGPMAVVGITAAAGIAAGAVSYKIANPVATWSAKKVGQVADLAKNAICEVGKNIAVGVINLATGKGKHSNKVSAQKQEKQKEGHKKQ